MKREQKMFKRNSQPESEDEKTVFEVFTQNFLSCQKTVKSLCKLFQFIFVSFKQCCPFWTRHSWRREISHLQNIKRSVCTCIKMFRFIFEIFKKHFHKQMSPFFSDDCDQTLCKNTKPNMRNKKDEIRNFTTQLKIYKYIWISRIMRNKTWGKGVVIEVTAWIVNLTVVGLDQQERTYLQDLEYQQHGRRFWNNMYLENLLKRKKVNILMRIFVVYCFKTIIIFFSLDNHVVKRIHKRFDVFKGISPSIFDQLSILKKAR